MMISHKHRCVFVHIPKCGGQSIEDIFLRDNGLTWKTRSPLVLKKNFNPKKGPPRLAHLSYFEYVGFGYISSGLIKDYTTFSVVRNPYKRVESLYKFLGFDSAIPFDRFVLDVLRPQIRSKGRMYWFVKPQVEYLADNEGKIMVDYIVKLEELSEKLPPILKKIGIEVEEVPHINRSGGRSILKSLAFRLLHSLNGHVSFVPIVNNKIIWSDALMSVVEDVYMADFNELGYSFR